MGVEHLFGHKTGPTKFDIVFQTILKTAQDLATAGKIPGQLDNASIASLIESIVQELKAQGVLTPEIATTIMSNSASAMIGGKTVKIIGGSLQLGI